MRMALISRDESLIDLCRNLMATLLQRLWELVSIPPDVPVPSQADILVIDRDQANPDVLRAILPEVRPSGSPVTGRMPSRRHDRDAALHCLAGEQIVSVERRRQQSRHPNAHRMEVSGPVRSGSGLELAICRWILAAPGGRIVTESGGPGVTFVFDLPFSSPHQARSSEAGRGGIHLVAETVGGDGA